MSNNCFISHEIIYWVKKRKKGNSFACILKIDLIKTYDRIRWNFVEAMLRRILFPECWITGLCNVLQQSLIQFWWMKSLLNFLAQRSSSCRPINFLHASSFCVWRFSPRNWSLISNSTKFKVWKLHDQRRRFPIYSLQMTPYFSLKQIRKIVGRKKRYYQTSARNHVRW